MLFFNFICLFYLMVLINCHTISKSIADVAEFNDIIDSINGLDYTTEYISKHDRFRLKHRSENKDDDTKSHKKSTTRKETIKNKHKTHKITTEANVREHKSNVTSPALVLSLWNRLNLFRQKDKVTTKKVKDDQSFTYDNTTESNPSFASNGLIIRKRKSILEGKKKHVKQRRAAYSDANIQKKVVSAEHEVLIRPSKHYKTYQPIDNYTNVDKFMPSYETTTSLSWEKPVPVVYNLTPYTNEDNLKVDFKFNTMQPNPKGPVTKDDYGTAALESLINQIKIHAIKMIADQEPSVTDIITNAVTESTYAAESAIASKTRLLAFTPEVVSSKTTRTLDILSPTEPVTAAGIHSIDERSVKELEKEVKCAYNKAKCKIQHKVGEAYSQVKSTTKKYIDKSYKKLKDIAKKFGKQKAKCPTCKPCASKKNLQLKDSAAMEKTVEVPSPTEPIGIAIIGKRQDENLKESGDVKRLPVLEDDYSMLNLYEKMLAKTHEDNLMKMLTTQSPIRKRSVQIPKPNVDSQKRAKKKSRESEEDLEDIIFDVENATIFDKEALSSLGLTTQDSTYEGLTNKISYNAYVNGFKHYLNFAKELDDRKFSDTIRYQAHRHHSVDDIGKFILNKLPPVPTFMRRRRRHFFDDTDTEDQDISTKSDDSWFKKHFYIYLDNSSQKKLHTSQMTPDKFSPHFESRYTRIASTRESFSPEDEHHSFKVDDHISFKDLTSKSTTEMTTEAQTLDYEEETKEPEADLETAINKLESKKIDDKVDSVINQTRNDFGEKMKEEVENTDEFVNRKNTNESVFMLKSPQYLINKILRRTGHKNKGQVVKLKDSKQELRQRRCNKDMKFDTIHMKDEFPRKSVSSLLDPVSLASSTTSKYKNYGYVDLNLVEKKTTRARKKKKKKSRIKSLFNKMTFRKDTAKPKRDVRKRNPFKFFKSMFRKQKNQNFDGDYNYVNSKFKYNSVPDAKELFREVPNITMDEFLFVDKGRLTTKTTTRNAYNEWTTIDVKNVPATEVKPSDSVFKTPFDDVKFKIKMKDKKQKVVHAKHRANPTTVEMLSVSGSPVAVTTVTYDDLMELSDTTTSTNLPSFSPSTEKMSPKYIMKGTVSDKYNYYPSVSTVPNMSKIKFKPQNIVYADTKSRDTIPGFPSFGSENPFIAVITRAEVRKDRHTVNGPSDDKSTLTNIEQKLHAQRKKPQVDKFYDSEEKDTNKEYDEEQKKQEKLSPQQDLHEKKAHAKYNTVTDYFGDLMNWNKDVLDADTVKLQKGWEEALKMGADLTTPDINRLRSEILNMNKYLKSFDTSRPDEQKDTESTKDLKDDTMFLNKMTSKKPELKFEMTGERKQKHVGRKKTTVAATHKRIAKAHLTPMETDESKMLAIDTTILSYDDTINAVTDTIKTKTTKYRAKSKGTSPIAKINTPPRQYFATPMPMPMTDFEKFLKDHDLDVQSITSPFSGISKLEGDFMKKINLKPKSIADMNVDRQYKAERGKSKTAFEDAFDKFDSGNIDDDVEFINQIESSLIDDQFDEQDKLHEDYLDVATNATLRGLRSDLNVTEESSDERADDLNKLDITIIDISDKDHAEDTSEEEVNAVAVDDPKVLSKMTTKTVNKKSKCKTVPHQNVTTKKEKTVGKLATIRAWYTPKPLLKNNDLNKLSKMIDSENKFSKDLLKHYSAADSKNIYTPAEIVDQAPAENFQLINKVTYGDAIPKRLQICHTYKYDVLFHDALDKSRSTRRNSLVTYRPRPTQANQTKLTTNSAPTVTINANEVSSKTANNMRNAVKQFVPSRRSIRKAIWRKHKTSDPNNPYTDTPTTKKSFMPNILRSIIDKLKSFSSQRDSCSELPSSMYDTNTLMVKTNAYTDFKSTTTTMKSNESTSEKKREGRETKSEDYVEPEQIRIGNTTTEEPTTKKDNGSKDVVYLKNKTQNVEPGSNKNNKKIHDNNEKKEGETDNVVNLQNTTQNIKTDSDKNINDDNQKKEGENNNVVYLQNAMLKINTDSNKKKKDIEYIYVDNLEDLAVMTSTETTPKERGLTILLNDDMVNEFQVQTSTSPAKENSSIGLFWGDAIDDDKFGYKQMSTLAHPNTYTVEQEGWVIYEADEENIKPNATLDDEKKLEIDVTIGVDYHTDDSQEALIPQPLKETTKQETETTKQETEMTATKKAEIQSDTQQSEASSKDAEEKAYREKAEGQKTTLKDNLNKLNEEIGTNLGESEENVIKETENKIKEKTASIIKEARKKVIEQDKEVTEKSKTLPEGTVERKVTEKAGLGKGKPMLTENKPKPSVLHVPPSAVDKSLAPQKQKNTNKEEDKNLKTYSEEEKAKAATEDSVIRKAQEKENVEKALTERERKEHEEKIKMEKTVSIVGKSKSVTKQIPPLIENIRHGQKEQIKKVKNEILRIIEENRKATEESNLKGKQNMHLVNTKLESEIKKIKEKVDAIINPSTMQLCKVDRDKFEFLNEKQTMLGKVTKVMPTVLKKTTELKQKQQTNKVTPKPVNSKSSHERVTNAAAAKKSSLKPTSKQNTERDETYLRSKDVTTDRSFMDTIEKVSLKPSNKEKREVQESNKIYTAKGVAALEIIVDLMKENQDKEPIITTPIAKPIDSLTKNTNAIQVHIAIPFVGNTNDKKRAAVPEKLRKVFSAKMSEPVDLEYQIKSYDISDETTEKTTKVTDKNMISPGMYVLVERPADNNLLSNIALRPVEARHLPADKNMESVETSTKDYARVTLTRDFIQSINDQLLKLYQNLSSLNSATEKIRKKRDENAVKSKTRRRLRKMFDWNIFNDRTCTCKCEVNKTMCETCAASDSVMTELLFEFDNLAKYMNDHCTELQTYFWMNPTGGRKLRDLVKRMDRTLTDYYKRVKGKCQGKSCKTVQACIDKRQVDISKADDKKYIGEPLLNDLVLLSNDFTKAANYKIFSPNDVIGKKVNDLVRVTRNCVSKPNAKARYLKNVYSLDNINVNIICSQDKQSLVNSTMANLNTPPVVFVTEPSIPDSYLNFDDTEISKYPKIRGLKTFFKKKNRKHLKRHADTNLPKSLNIPAVNTGDGLEIYKAPKSQKPIIRLRVLEVHENKSVTLRPDLKATIVKIIPNISKEKYMNEIALPEHILNPEKIKKTHKDEISETSSTKELLSYNMNELIKVFESLPDVQDMKTLLPVTSPTGTVEPTPKKQTKESKEQKKEQTKEQKKEQTKTQTKARPKVKEQTKSKTKQKVKPTKKVTPKVTRPTPTTKGKSSSVTKSDEIWIKAAKSTTTKKSWIQKLKIMITGRGDDDDATTTEGAPRISSTETLLLTTTAVQTNKEERKSRSPEVESIHINSSATTTHAYPTIFIIEEFAEKPDESAKIFNDKDGLLISILKYEQGKLNNDMRRFVQKYNRSFGFSDPDDIFIVQHNLDESTSPILTTSTQSYTNWLDNYSEIDSEMVQHTKSLKNAFSRLLDNFGKKEKEIPKADQKQKRLRLQPPKKWYKPEELDNGEISVNIPKTTLNKKLSLPATETKPTTKGSPAVCVLPQKDRPSQENEKDKTKLSIRITNTNPPILAEISSEKNRNINNTVPNNLYQTWQRIPERESKTLHQKLKMATSFVVTNGTTERGTKKKISISMLKNRGNNFAEACDPNAEPCICNVHATTDFVASLSEKLSKEAFESYVRDFNCTKYVKPPEYFVIQPTRKHTKTRVKFYTSKTPSTELKWNWVRRRRSLLSADDEEHTDDGEDIESVDELNAGRDFERLYKDDYNVYRKRRKTRRKRMTDLKRLALGLDNLPPLTPAKDEVYAMLGDGITMRCQHGDNRVNWLAERQDMLKQDNVDVKDGLVLIRKVQAKNSGNYTCFVNEQPVQIIKLSVITLPRFKVVFIPMYYSDSGCSYEDLHDVQNLGEIMSRDGCGCRHNSIQISEPICLEDKDDSSVHLRATAVLATCHPPALKCSARCRRDYQARVAWLNAANVPALSGVKVVLSRSSGNRRLTPSTKNYRQMIVTHTLRKKDLESNKEYHQIAASMSPGNMDIVVSCPAGYYLLSKTKICAACPSDSFAQPGSNVCTACPVGMRAEPGARRCRLSLRRLRRYDWWADDWLLYVAISGIVVCACCLCSVCSALRRPGRVDARGVSVARVESRWTWSRETAQKKSSTIAAGRGRPLSPSAVILARFFRASPSTSPVSESQETKFEQWKEKNIPPPLPPVDFDQS